MEAQIVNTQAHLVSRATLRELSLRDELSRPSTSSEEGSTA
jgi:hypothetical protein